MLASASRPSATRPVSKNRTLRHHWRTTSSPAIGFDPQKRHAGVTLSPLSHQASFKKPHFASPLARHKFSPIGFDPQKRHAGVTLLPLSHQASFKKPHFASPLAHHKFPPIGFDPKKTPRWRHPLAPQPPASFKKPHSASTTSIRRATARHKRFVRGQFSAIRAQSGQARDRAPKGEESGNHPYIVVGAKPNQP